MAQVHHQAAWMAAGDEDLHAWIETGVIRVPYESQWTKPNTALKTAVFCAACNAWGLGSHLTSGPHLRKSSENWNVTDDMKDVPIRSKVEWTFDRLWEDKIDEADRLNSIDAFCRLCHVLLDK